MASGEQLPRHLHEIHWEVLHSRVNLLEDSINVTVANPKWVRAVKGNKDDAKDSKWIGDLFRLGLVPGSFIPGKELRILREFMRYRFKLVSCKSSEKNRYQNVFTVCNVALDAVVSDMFGVSASSVTDYIVNGNESAGKKKSVRITPRRGLPQTRVG